MEAGLRNAPRLEDEEGMAKLKQKRVASEEEQKEEAIEETLQEREDLYRRLTKT